MKIGFSNFVLLIVAAACIEPYSVLVDYQPMIVIQGLINIPLHSFALYNSDANYRAGEGYSPNFLVAENINDLISGKDSAMELAIEKLSE